MKIVDLVLKAASMDATIWEAGRRDAVSCIDEKCRKSMPF